jgi:UDP-N-acetylglucosamine 2-epimerase
MKLVSIVGARPQFIKAAVLSRALRRAHQEILVHTGQHYDDEMSAVFFRQLSIPEPDVNLGVGSGSHAWQTGEMLVGIEGVLLRERPDAIVVYGDTNSTVAGALAAAKLVLPVAHVEAGLRSFNRAMAEEVNRVVADQIAACLLCPSATAVENLRREGIVSGVHLVGDVMADALLDARSRAAGTSRILEALALEAGHFLLVTVHRAENTDDPERLAAIVAALDVLGAAGETVVFPAHPRTRKALASLGVEPPPAVRIIEPVGYLDMVRLEGAARAILTDSGGVQKEAYWLGVPCVTLRDETEWVETIANGWNVLAGADTERVVAAVRGLAPPAERPPLYGDGHAAERSAAKITDLA